MRNVIGLILLLLPGLSFGFSCSGTVSRLSVGLPSGVVELDTGHGIHYICKLNGTYNAIEADICRAWYSMALAAKLSGSEIEQSYPNVSGEDCTTLGNWSDPDPAPNNIQIK